MAEWVRVSSPAGHFSVPRTVFERSNWRELKQDALDERGRPLPPKPREDVEDASPARKTAAKKATAKRAAKKAATPEPRVDSDAATPTTAEDTSGEHEEQA